MKLNIERELRMLSIALKHEFCKHTVELVGRELRMPSITTRHKKDRCITGEDPDGVGRRCQRRSKFPQWGVFIWR